MNALFRILLSLWWGYVSSNSSILNLFMHLIYRCVGIPSKHLFKSRCPPIRLSVYMSVCTEPEKRKRNIMNRDSSEFYEKLGNHYNFHQDR
jgi:hypothetical protein